jgi:CheY-like chemotaxis protein
MAEDGRVNQMVAVKLLEDRGHRVTAVENGRLAVDAALKDEGRYDVILMDIQMPEMNGLEATAAIRRVESETPGRRIPIVAMTANAMDGDRETCLKGGMDGYVSKPIRAEELFGAIEVFGRLEKGNETPTTSEIEDLKVDEISGERLFDADLFRKQYSDAALMTELIGVFDEEVTEALDQLRKALANEDAEACHRAAHSLKGLVGNYASRAVLGSATALDEASRNHDLTATAGHLSQLERLTEKLGDALTEFRGTLD